jgi:hypothetical protein
MTKVFLRLWAFVAVSATLLAAMAVPADAQKILEEFQKPLPEHKWEMMTQEEFEAETILHEDVPLGDEALSYKIRLPKGWEQPEGIGISNYTLSDKLLGEIAVFYGPPKMYMRSRFTIEALALEYQLTAEQWFIQHLLRNGYTIQGMEVINDKRVEALFFVVEKDVTYVVRSIAEISGKRAVLAQYFLPTRYWNDEKMLQSEVMKSFSLLQPDVEDAEDMKKFYILDIAEFLYPSSWELKAEPIRSIDRLEVEIRSSAKRKRIQQKDDWKKSRAQRERDQEERTLHGRINVQLVSNFVAESLEDEIAKLKTKVLGTSLVAGNLIETQDSFIYDDAISFGETNVYEAVDENSELLEYEIWFTVMGAGDYYYFVTLLTPSRDDDFFVWSRNTQTYKFVVENLTLQADSLSGED